MPNNKPGKIHTKSTSYRWFRMYQEPLAFMAKNREFTGPTLRVYLGLLSILNFKNEAIISQKALAVLVDLKQPEVSKALAILQRNEVITKEINKYGITVYRINSSYALKGDTKTLELIR